MLEEKIDVGEADEQEQEIDLDKPVETPKEEKIEVEEAPVVETEEKPAEEGKEELSEYSEGVNKRIAKLTRKMREAERQKEEAIQYAKNIRDQAIKTRHQYNSLGSDYAKELADKIATGKLAARAALKEATEAGDVDKQVLAQEAIAKLAMEEERLVRVKATNQSNTPAPRQVPPQNYAQMAQDMPTQNEIYNAAQEIDPKAETWSAKNAWFGTDNAMTYTAFDIHRRLVEEEGFDPSSNEYYSEVDKRIRLEFPHKFDTNRDTAADGGQVPTQTVASARRPAAKGRRKTVRLTPSQVAISKRLGVPLEEYAKQLTAMEDTA